MVYRWLKNLQYSLFPPTCLLCGAPGEDNWDLCLGCQSELPSNAHPCRRCAMPLTTSAALVCGECQQHPPTFDSAFAPLLYQPPVDFLVKELKFHGRLAVAELLGGWLAEALKNRTDALPECIIPVPLHLTRLRERGFNQALEIAQPVARRLAIALRFDSVRRIIPTVPQSQLDAQMRRTNVQGAFMVNRPIQARHVAIIDDVTTTGSTVTEIAKALRAAGVERIEVWVCARTVGHA